MKPEDWLMLALGEAVFLAAMAALVWLVRRDMRARAKDELAAKQRPFIVVRKSEPMDDARVVMAISQLGENHPAWLAVNQILTEQMESAASQISEPQMAMEHGKLAYTAGWLESLRTFQNALWDAHSGRRIE